MSNHEIKLRVHRPDNGAIVAVEVLTEKGWMHKLANNIVQHGWDAAQWYAGCFDDFEFGWSEPLKRARFIGAHDSKGKEAYEGDVVVLEDTESEFVDVGVGVDMKVAETKVGALAKIVWHGHGWAFDCPEGGEK